MAAGSLAPRPSDGAQPTRRAGLDPDALVNPLYLSAVALAGHVRESEGHYLDDRSRLFRFSNQPK
jgi:hypothetical protein